MPAPAKKIPKTLSIHGDDRVDPYFWLNERDTKPVLDYLEAQNEHTESVLEPTLPLQEQLMRELRARIKEEDTSVPVPDGGYLYYARFVKGGEYPLFARRKGTMEAPEEMIVDGNLMGSTETYFQCTFPSMSPDHTCAGFGTDTVGRRFYDLHFKDMKTGQMRPDFIANTTGQFVWANDNKTIFFCKQHPETLRSYQLFRYELGSGVDPDLVYEETDETYGIGISKSKNEHYLFMNIWKRDSSEVRFLDASTPIGSWQTFFPRQGDIEYSIEDGGDEFFVLTNWNAPNYRVMTAPAKPTDKSVWKEIFAHDAKIYLDGLDVYQNFLLIAERSGGLQKIRAVDRKTWKARTLDFPDPTYVVDLAPLPDYASRVFRFSYMSLHRPTTAYEENFATEKREVLKVREVPTLKPENYESRRLWAKAPDGAAIPISVLVKKGLKLDGQSPLLLEGYGSYGLSNDPQFHRDVFSLVDRGFTYAIAHIRGGSEMGREWYEQGRLANKKNTFTDFIAAAEYLIHENYTSSKHLYTWGGSAGGLLMGAIINMRPDLFNGVVAAVPFVDVVTTMLDETLPLTTGEYREWGDPRKKEDYLYIKSYSPYDNVKAQAYPNLLVTTGYHDSQVQYWEPAKWVAKLNEVRTNDNQLLLFTEMGAGHSGASGRFEALKTTAIEYAFYLQLEGITK